MRQLNATDINFYYRPSKCSRRIDCRARGLSEAEPGPYDQVLRDIGILHEARHLATLSDVTDLSMLPMDVRRGATVDAIRRAAPVLYQPLLVAPAPFSSDATIVGVPDFLVLDGADYRIRDCKIARRVDTKNHPEIVEQVDLYGWLYEMVVERPPAGLEVVAGAGDMVRLPYEHGRAALSTLARIDDVMVKGLSEYVAVGWSKCGGCAYRTHCWDAAFAAQDPAVLPDVDQSTAAVLQAMGIKTYRELPVRFTAETLAVVKHAVGERMQKIGKKAVSILNHARAFETSDIVVLAPAVLPPSANYVMFDLEGLPPQLNDNEKIYLWGTQVFGDRPGQCLQATADFGTDGDRNGWTQFLDNAAGIFAQYDDIPFVHWAVYEKTYVTKYIERFGDPAGVGARVLANLCDLLPITKAAIVLPDPSYSIKLVEKRAGYKRTLPETNGAWSIAQYIKAVETEDEELRSQTMDQIRLYNREDLEATWAVMTWLGGRGSG